MPITNPAVTQDGDTLTLTFDYASGDRDTITDHPGTVTIDPDGSGPIAPVTVPYVAKEVVGASVPVVVTDVARTWTVVGDANNKVTCTAHRGDAPATGAAGTGDLTVAMGALTKKVGYTVTYPAPPAPPAPVRPKVAMGVCTTDWDEAVARIGPIKIARRYCTAGQALDQQRKFAADHPDVHVIVSVQSRGLDRDLFRKQLAAWPVTPAGTTVVVDHEPLGGTPQKCDTPAEYVTGQRNFIADYAAAGSPKHIKKGAILHGWMASTQPWATKKFTGLGGYETCWPADVLAGLDIIGWDLYDDADYPNYGKALGPGYKLDVVAALALKWDKPYLLGEVGTFDPVNQQDFFVRLAKVLNPPKMVAWWDHAETHCKVEGDLLTAFRAAMA